MIPTQSACSPSPPPSEQSGRHFQGSFDERKSRELLECRLAIAEKDLRTARDRGDMNAIERAVRDVNIFRKRSGLPSVPKLPPHLRDPSLQERVGRFPNGTILYRRGFGFSVDQTVEWVPTAGAAPRPGTVLQIFEYGRNPIVVFQPEGGTAFWASPYALQAMRVHAAPTEMQSEQSESSLLIMPCSGMKLPHAAPAREIYTGVMWQSLRANGPMPEKMVILSAKHGIVLPEQLIEPYEQRMDEQRALELREQAAAQARTVSTALGAVRPRQVFIAGGKLYRSVALAIVGELRAGGLLDEEANVACTDGAGIGLQRAQLGQFLRERTLR